ncbi:NADP-dependent oxidoreductase [Actinoplanes friuliensis]|uniref:NADPH:quinone reductase-like protein n=1 Tax=Actinoplanes friuliensis DSM 7358 TaxID=1246995 RepID=U5VWB2_9ACTN|nr:NADP-dependent oxidoreductase [Actinoplanes friuliensis]AGZ40025.1 NADPH:quinone reductase-like protein [Actinoplanes friuliensis DSM 7358]
MIRTEDVPVPAPGPGEVLIRVVATSMNPTEAALRAGYLAALLPIELPLTLGWDVAGTVDGAPVLAMLDGGAAAEYAVAPAAALVPAPATVPLADAAVLPLAGMTAWQAVFEHARVAPGERVLINGAGGGIGGFAVQLARHAGAHVIATASPRSAAAIEADQLLDYTAGPLAVDEPVDVVLNCAAISAGAAAALPALARPGARIVTVATPVPGGRHFVVRNDPADLSALVKMVDEGALRLTITGRRTLNDLPELHRLAESGGLHGKVVVTVP